MRALIAAAGALLAYLVWSSLSWRVTGDVPLYHYIAWLMSEGQVPYRDIFDFNMPGVFLIHRALLAIGGPGDGTWRLFDLGCLALISALLYLFCRPPAGRWGAAGAALLFALYHLAGGQWMTGQRDFLLSGLVLAAMLAICRFREREGGWRWLAVAGLTLGTAAIIKPFAVVIWLGCAAAAGLAAGRAARRRWKAAAVVVAAGAVAPALVAVWLAASGALRPFLSILFGYTLPFYGALGSGPLGVWRQAGLSVDGWPIVLFIAFLGLLGWTVPLSSTHLPRRWLALLGVAYGVANYSLQGKGYLYHLYPLVCFLLALGAPALGRPAEDGTGGLAAAPVPSGRGPAATLSPRQVAAATFAVALLALGIGGVTGRSAFDADDRFSQRGDLLTRELSELVPPGESVQTLDDTWANSTLALLRLGIRQPTPIITDTPLFVAPRAPYIRDLRERFVAAFVAARPAALVVSKHNMVSKRFDRVDELPGLGDFLRRNYKVAIRRERAYLIWLRNDLAASPSPSRPPAEEPRSDSDARPAPPAGRRAGG